MSNQRQKGVPYGYSSTPGSDGSSRTGLIVIGVVVALVLVAGVVALVVTSEGGQDTASDAVQEQGSVEVNGDPLPQYPSEGGLAADPATDPAVGTTPPTLTGEGFDGEPVTIEPGGGTPMVVVFAAHWCPHCQAEIPIIQDWIDEGNLPEDVQVNMVSTGVQADQNNYPPSEWLAQEGWSEQVLLDNPDQSAAQAYGLSGYPYMVFVDGDGEVVQRASGELPIDQFGSLVDQIAV